MLTRIMNIELGEIVVAEIYKDDNNQYRVKVPSTGGHIIEENKYSTAEEAYQGACFLVPAECRLSIRCWLNACVAENQPKIEALKEFRAELWGEYDIPQESCPHCGEVDNIANEDGPENGFLPITCHECGYQWLEPE